MVAIRIHRYKLESHDATQLDETKDMDIEKGNYIVSDTEARNSRIEIPLNVETANKNKFLMTDWQRLNDFIDANLSSESLIEKSR
ncbi:MAG: hypothetical protein WAW92_02805 [Minisyncoccia bacterium]